MITKRGKYKANFDYMVNEPDTFEIAVRCGNCWHQYDIRVKKGTKIQNSHLKFLKCKRCDISGMIFRVGWNGHVYVKLESLQ